MFCSLGAKSLSPPSSMPQSYDDVAVTPSGAARGAGTHGLWRQRLLAEFGFVLPAVHLGQVT